MSRPLVSIIIIDYKKHNPYRIEALSAINKQTYRNFEIILVSDYPISDKQPKLKKKSYGRYMGPAQKRDDGAKLASGSILAFLDDDAYPSKNWLKSIVKHFDKSDTAAVGGPGVTPPDVSWTEEASGWASASPVGAASYTYRFLPRSRREVDDYPSMNLAVRKTDFDQVKGFDSHYWPGEDTKLCLDLTEKLGKKIIYEPKALVYHHRRPILLPHLKQNGNFGLHRGFFARVLPKTSFRLVYFLPSLMTLGLIFLVITPYFSNPYITMLTQLGGSLFGVYFASLFINAIWVLNNSGKITQALVSIPVIFVTHLWYGIRFMQGFFLTSTLKQ